MDHKYIGNIFKLAPIWERNDMFSSLLMHVLKIIK